MISGATESSYKFLYEKYIDFPSQYIEIHHIPELLLKSNKKIKILWAHHGHDQPIYLNVDWNKITHIVCVSNWQKEQFIKYFKLPGEKITVIRNGGADYFTSSNTEKEKTLIYTSTPFRGLKYLPYIFKNVLAKHSDAKLKVFSGMSLYGNEDTNEFKKLYDELRSIPNVYYSQPINHTELVKEYQKAAIFCYPNTWEETSCVSLIESLRCGCYPIISNIGALRETSLGFGSVITMNGISKSDGWVPHIEFLDRFSDKIISVLDNYKYLEAKLIADTAQQYYSWDIISEEWKILITKLLRKNEMTTSISTLVESTPFDIANDSKALQRAFDEIFKWEKEDLEHAQGRTNFQIEKFIVLDNFTISSAFNAALKNRRMMAEGLFSKITEMKEQQREFEFKWESKNKEQPIEWFTPDGGKKLCWYDLDYAKYQHYMKSSELELRDRVQQIDFFDKILNKLIEMNGGPITKEQYENEDHIYWERRFANQAFDEMVSRQTGISIGNLHSMRRGTAPTLVSNDLNRIKNGYPDLNKALTEGDSKIEFILGLQEKVMQGIEEVTGNGTNLLGSNKQDDPLLGATEVSPASLFNDDILTNK